MDELIQNPEISVIIPVYNVAPYIRECAESLFNQTQQSIEYIFIDDFSTDNSLEILNDVVTQFPDRQSQIKIISNKENKGISFCRQKGLSLAKGKWVIHCDSDDLVRKDCYETMLSKANTIKGDIIICSYKLFGETVPDIIKYQGEGNITPQQLIQSLSGNSDRIIHGSLCNKLIKTELCRNINLDNNISFCEDEIFLYNLLVNNRNINIEIIPDCLYYYRVHPKSLTFKKDEKRVQDILRLIDKLEEMSLQHPDFSKSFNSKIVSLLYQLLYYRPSIENFSKKYRNYLPYISLNHQLNRLKKIELSEALKGSRLTYNFIRRGNKCGLNIIRIVKKIRKGM